MRVRKSSSTAFRNGWSVRGDSATVLCAGHLTCWPGSIKTGSPRAASIRPMAVTEKKYHVGLGPGDVVFLFRDRKSTRLNSSHGSISYAVFCLKKKTT